MSPAMLRRIAGALVAALLLWAVVFVWRRGERDDRGVLSLPAIDTARVELVALRRAADTIVASRAAGEWTVNGFPASAEYVSGFLAAYGDSATRTELVARSPASHSRLGVDSVVGRRLTIAVAGKVVTDLVLGSRGPDFEGVYLRPEGDSTVYLLRGRITDLLLDGVDVWRERRIIAVPADSIGTVEVVAGRSRWELVRRSGGWEADGLLGDSIKVRRYLAQFESLRASGFPDAAAEPPGFDGPGRSVSLSAGDGRLLARLEFVDAGSGAFWVREAGHGVVYRLPAATVELVAPPRPGLTP